MVTNVCTPHLSHNNTLIHRYQKAGKGWGRGGGGGRQGNGKMIEVQIRRITKGKKKVRGVKRRKKLDE